MLFFSSDALSRVTRHAEVTAPPTAKRGFVDLQRLRTLPMLLSAASIVSTSRSFLTIHSGECRRDFYFLLMENPLPELAPDFSYPGSVF